jgi:hypothetical protein
MRQAGSGHKGAVPRRCNACIGPIILGFPRLKVHTIEEWVPASADHYHRREVHAVSPATTVRCFAAFRQGGGYHTRLRRTAQ